MEPDNCPKCGATALVLGRLADGGDGGGVPFFVPKGGRTFRLKVGVRLPSDAFQSCLSCGHLWASLPPEDLRGFIESYGKELARQRLATLDDGPYRDLPDIPEAYEAGRVIAAIDALALDGKDGEATSTYRRATGAPRDRGVAAIRRWPRLTRAEKLAMFGWAPKEKAAVDDWANPFP